MCLACRSMFSNVSFRRASSRNSLAIQCQSVVHPLASRRFVSVMYRGDVCAKSIQGSMITLLPPPLPSPPHSISFTFGIRSRLENRITREHKVEPATSTRRHSQASSVTFFRVTLRKKLDRRERERVSTRHGHADVVAIRRNIDDNARKRA